MKRPLTTLTLLLLMTTLFAGVVEARPRGGFGGGGFGGFGRSRPSFSRPSTPSAPFSYRPRISTPTPSAPPRATVPPPVTPPPTTPSTGGFGGGRATGVVGAPAPPAAPASVPKSGAFGGGEATGVAGANARKPVTSKPATAPPNRGPGSSGPGVTSRPDAAPAPGNVYREHRRVEPIRGSQNVYVYDNRPFWGFMPFWWYPPIYTPYGAMVSPGGANPLAILMTLLVLGLVGTMIYTAVRRR